MKKLILALSFALSWQSMHADESSKAIACWIPNSPACKYETDLLEKGKEAAVAAAKQREINAAADYWIKDNTKRQENKTLPPGTYASDTRIRGCGWGSHLSGIVTPVMAVLSPVVLVLRREGSIEDIASTGLDLHRFLTCTAETASGPVTSSILTNNDESSYCSGDIKLNAAGQLKCTKWTGSGSRPEDMAQ